jgi:cell division protein ZapA (FtsZ GTPase activity inhibitor)
MSNLQKIRLLGSSFSLKVDEDPEYFEKVINHIEKMFSKIEIEMKVTEPLRIAVLSCILLTDDLLKDRKKMKGTLSTEEAEKVEKMTLEIISLIDKNF